MRKGDYAIYKGKEYYIDITIDDELVLRSVNLEDLKNGFKPCKPITVNVVTKEKAVCQKIVDPLELEDVYKISLQAVYKGMRFSVAWRREGTNIVCLETLESLPYIPAGEETEIEPVKTLIEMGFYDVQPEYGNCWYRKDISADDPEIEFIEEKEEAPWLYKIKQNAEKKKRQERWRLKKSAVRCGKYAFHNGGEYSAVREADKLMLYSENPNDFNNGFEPCECGPVRQRFVCFKQIHPSEAEETYIIRLHAVYRGLVFDAMCEKEEPDRITLETPYCLPHNPAGEQLEVKNRLDEMKFGEGRHEGDSLWYEKDVSVNDPNLELVEERIETDDKFIPIKRKSRVIKCGKYAIYNGREYPVQQNEDGSFTLLSGSLGDIEKGFELCEPFTRDFTEEEVVCVKHVDISEMDETYEIRARAVYKDMSFRIAKRKKYEADILNLCTQYIISDSQNSLQFKIKTAIYKRGFSIGKYKYCKNQDNLSGYWYEKRVAIDDPELEIIGEKVKTDNKFIPVKEETYVKYGGYAVYMGKEYISTGLEDGRLVLCSGSLFALKEGFKICKPFICRYTGEEIVCIKYVDPFEIEDYYELNTKVIYDENEYYAGAETDEEIEIVDVTKKGKDNRLDMEMECIADGIYTKWIKKSEAEIKTVKEEILWFKELKQREKDKSMADLTKK